MNNSKIFFFMGKGGTGKSTVSAISGLMLAESKKKVMVISLDSAHNLSDIYETPLAHKPREIGPFLHAGEIDQEKMIQKYLKDVQLSLKRRYSYLTAFNIENYFDILKYSPGLEEYALMLAFNNIIDKYSNFDYIIFDMPPTALSLKFFNLPFLSGKWIEHLEDLRCEINKKREIISKVKFAGKEYERDKILSKIRELKDQYQSIGKIFQDSDRTGVFIVINYDSLAVSETRRIFNSLEKIKISIKKIIWNRKRKGDSFDDIDNSFSLIPFLSLPFSSERLTGFNALNNYIKAVDLKVSDFFKQNKK